MKGIVLTLIAATLVGCGTMFFKPEAAASLECEGEQCKAMWDKAQTWLAKNSRYRMQMVTDSVIQTYGPHENVYDGVAYTITKTKATSGKTLISIQGSCYPTVYGCVFDPVPATNQLFYALRETD